MAHFRGGCLCGAVRYEVTAEPVAAGDCHCRDCQYVSGGAPAHVIVIPRAGLEITAGAPRVYASVSAKGGRVARHFCPACGTPLFSENALRGDLIAIKVGSLDDPSRFEPQGIIWVRSAQPWAHIDPDLPQWAEDPN